MTDFKQLLTALSSETRYMMWYYIGHILTFFRAVVLTTGAFFVGFGF